jgi:hypothetical protein
MRGIRKYLVHTLRTDESLDAEPEHRQDDETDDAEVAQPEPERGAIDDRERYTKPDPDGTTKHNDNRNDEVSQRDCQECPPPAGHTSASQIGEISSVGEQKSYQDNPIAIIDEASSHTVTLATHEIQKVM